LSSLLLGGPLEIERNGRIAGMADGAAIDAGCDHSLPDFAALVACCDAVVTADTLAMHLAIAAKKPVVVLMGPTCEAEIELYGRGTKITSDAPCAPCYRATCDKGHVCMEDISAAQVFASLEEHLK
ncbi:MAG: glycosyltransferase family 9 protein, partial [Candidatus Coatesbacteria bacterium]|nr:glycosyltransferase family 9 protein [Candidatus Coatesbacteria bacterium]